MSITGIVLAGGNSSRMGTNKAWVMFNGKPLIDYAIEALLPVCNRVILSTNQPTSHRNLEVWPDILPGKAPIVGIYSCLSRIQTNAAFVLSCDMPMVNSQFVQFLAACHRPEHQLTIPLHNTHQIEPLCAIYSATAIPPMYRAIASQNYKLYRLAQSLLANYIPVEEAYPHYTPQLFSNINTQTDLHNLSQHF